MLRTLMILPLLALLVACQTSQVQRDFDPQRDYAAYRSWDWQEPGLQYRPDDPRIKSDLTEQRIRSAVTEQLDQRGLRQAQTGSSADVRVQAWFIVEQRTQQYSSTSMGAWGSPWHGYWGGPMYTDTRTLHYQVGTLQIDFYDADDGKLIWRGSTEQTLRSDPGGPQERASMLREAVARVLSQYPPR
ncbi:MAG: hypothetical protein B7Z23_01615 [Pseudomonadales bacterium 32-61-5]|uniref:DUF4136 domain-containing protein n=1 Tax=Stutzerimonas stutzeri TaxID=316 RepID=UPI000BC441F6|nr:DUF4136 domain-containing protein [Stutzerimonas stutzeri]MBF6623864.1 DUF4136 domain-containing protein [Stutzerimonas stutzeri]MCQ4240098.1 DUF4136 domain-containing protein [Stutzerimonas stutzeri]OYW96075.1 MAG: hypothetical protein B7Z23_01615 [Pseudomonadales bacterium 32-61-5]